MSRPAYLYEFSPLSDDNFDQARNLWKLANRLAEVAPSWGAASRAGHAHIIAASSLYGLAQSISEVHGVPLISALSSRRCSVENALLENLTRIARERGPQAAAELAYSLADGLATGIGGQS